MKTKKFIKRIRELGLFIQVNSTTSFIKKNDGTTYAVVDEKHAYSFDTFYQNYYYLEDNDKRILFNLIVKYASTPIEERKEEKKYYIKMKNLNEGHRYLNYDRKINEWLFHSILETMQSKTQFKLSELPYWVHTMIEQGHLIKVEVK